MGTREGAERRGVGRPGRAFARVWAAALLLAAGCAGAPPAADRVVVVTGKGFRVTAPAAWERMDTGADLALRDPIRRAALMAHATCEGPAATRGPGILARHLRFGLRDVQDLTTTPVTVAGLAGVRSRFTARLDQVAVAAEAVTVAGRGCVFDLVAIGPPGAAAAVGPDFDRFVASFTLLGAPP